MLWVAGAPIVCEPMSEEWRLQVELDDEEHGLSLGERLRSMSLDDEARQRLGERAIVTRDGSCLFVYTDSEEAAREAEGVVRELLEEDELSAEMWLARWHPDAEEWKDAEVPLPRGEGEREAERRGREAAALARAEETGELPYEVSVELPRLAEAEDLERSLREEGLPVHRRWRHVLVGAPSEERAEELAERLRRDLEEAEVSIEAHGVRYPAFTLLGWST
jgi:hypothetical protein